MDKQAIMLCLEKLDIGGIETAVVNLSIALNKKGYNVIILAKKGIYTDYIQKMGIKCIEYNFSIDNYYNEENEKKLINIIKENNVSQVHIHQYSCISHLFPVCLKLNIPYLAYIHAGYILEKVNVYDWFENQVPIYKSLFPLFYQNAYKVFVLTNDIKNYSIKRFGINGENIEVIPNSIDFSTYKSTKNVNKLKKFLLISRFSDEKMRSIYNSIDLVIEYYNKTNDNNIKLDIAGDGNKKEEIIKYITQRSKVDFKIKFLGAINDVPYVINNYDVVLGMGRCLLEAISCKRIAIVSGHEKLKGIITPSIIENCIQENFAIRNLPDCSIEYVIIELEKLNSDKINEITEFNYNYIKDRLNINNNLRTIPNTYSLKYKTDDIFKHQINILAETIQNIKMDRDSLDKKFGGKIEENKLLFDEIEILKKEKEKLAKENEKLSKENEKLSKELESIYSSKRWRYIDRIIKLFRK